MDIKHSIGAVLILLGSTRFLQAQECSDGQCKLRSTVQRIVDAPIEFGFDSTSTPSTSRIEHVVRTDTVIPEYTEVTPVVATTRYRTFKSQHKIRPMKRFNRCR